MDRIEKLLKKIKDLEKRLELMENVIHQLTVTNAEEEEHIDNPMPEGLILNTETDPLLPEAVKIARHFGKANTAMLQRALKIGYSRARRMLDDMEELDYIKYDEDQQIWNVIKKKKHKIRRQN